VCLARELKALRPDLSWETDARLTEMDFGHWKGQRWDALDPAERRVLEKLGILLGVNDVQRIWRTIDADISAAARSLPTAAHSARVYFEVNNGPYAAGEASFIGETLARLGVHNIVPASLGSFPKLNPEFVVRANPDLIMVGDYNYIGMEQRPGWSGMRALRDKRVCLFNRDETDMLARPGPRMADGARLMARCIADKLSTITSGTP
jgi:iron complex transport system substrate-binding protein